MGDPAMLSEITSLFREIGIHPSGATIDIQGGEITDTHADVLTPDSLSPRLRRRRGRSLTRPLPPQRGARGHLSGCTTFVPAGTWSSNCASLTSGFMVKVVICMLTRVPFFSTCTTSWG